MNLYWPLSIPTLFIYALYYLIAYIFTTSTNKPSRPVDDTAGYPSPGCVFLPSDWTGSSASCGSDIFDSRFWRPWMCKELLEIHKRKFSFTKRVNDAMEGYCRCFWFTSSETLGEISETVKIKSTIFSLQHVHINLLTSVGFFFLSQP